MKRLFQNKFMFFSVLGGVIVFAALVMFILSSGATVKAAVLNTDAKAGVTITDNMVQEIDVPAETPGDFFKSRNSLIGERLTSNVSANQLIYPGDLMSSIELVGGEKNEDYVVTSITVPDEQALGGLLTAGDVVDISVVPEDNFALAQALPDFGFSTAGDGGVNYILSNVTILDATTSVASEQGSNLASTIETGSSTTGSASTYLISLSYNDYKKLRIADQYGKIFLNLAPEQNNDNAPLLNQMMGGVVGGLTDAANGEDAEGKNPMKEHLDQNAPKVTSQSGDNNQNNDQNSDQNNDQNEDGNKDNNEDNEN